MIYSPKAIANFFIEIAKEHGESIRPMKLQKLVYYAHGWFAGHTGKPLIDETVEAWQYGPVISSLYHEFKRFGSNPITAKATDFVDFELVEVPPPKEETTKKFLSNVWNSYGKYTGLTLSEMTHAEGSPWELTWKEKAGVKGADIPFERIAEHFKALKEKAAQKAAA